MRYSRGVVLQIGILMAVCLGLGWGLNAQDACTGSNLKTRLPIQSIGRVIAAGGANNVRDTSSVSGNKIGALPPDSTFTVLEGPVCADDATWLRVDDGKGLTGWTVEIIGGEYALELVSLPPEAGTLFEAGKVDYEGVHFEASPDLVTQIEARFVEDELHGSETLPPALTFTLTKDVDGQKTPVGVIRVMSAQSFNNQYLMTIPLLQAVLAENPEARIAPQMRLFINEGSLIASGQTQPIPLGNGKAQRSLSLYGDDPLAPSNILTYEVHGLTDDGVYYIQAEFPVTYNGAFAPPTQDRNDPNLAAILDEFHTTIETALNGASFETFSPNPTQLDTLLSTLVIEPKILDPVIAEADVTATVFAATQQALPPEMQTATLSALFAPTAAPTCGTRVSRLKVGDQGQQILNGETLRVRQTPNGEPIPDTRLFFEDVVRVEEGPVCVEGVNWWRVTNGGWSGWIAEGDAEEYYMLPIVSTATPTLAATGVPTEAPSCGTLKPHLKVGDLGEQILKDETLRVRQSPNGEPIPDTRLFFEQRVRIEEGPVCVDGVNWWRVSALDGAWTGWIAEGDAKEYFMKNIASTPTPAPTATTYNAPPTQAYDCVYTATSFEHALAEPFPEGRWKYFLISGQTYHAIGRYVDSAGLTWYVLAHESPITGRDDGRGPTYNRAAWVSSASGSECGSLPLVDKDYYTGA